MLMTQKIATGLLLFTLSIFSVSARADLVIVVSAKSTASNLTEDQVANIFLGKANTIPGAGKAVPVDLPDGSAIKELFYSKVTGKSAAQLKAYWAKQIFTGKGQPPKTVDDNNGLKALLTANPDVIGYADKDLVDNTVKVLLTIK